MSPTSRRSIAPCERDAQGVGEQHLTVERVAFDEVDELIASGEIVDAKTIAGLLVARAHLARRDGTPAAAAAVVAPPPVTQVPPSPVAAPPAPPPAAAEPAVG